MLAYFPTIFKTVTFFMFSFILAIYKRMEFAKACLIHDPSKLISDIALEAGFSNDSQFCSMFKRETGMTPKMYREEQNKM
ncbi:hypothetical protein CAI16_16125 [Virgibacillus dokdonensis]|uniref:HTH araC/xylS-type domain-containing protein n=1 Tax=Virgibacillus dokdonensis TaxID=302167 RepID=A0A3E0WJ93_9BACI|nr:hypothetical protein CAI16_16125 [Virgibacillus dokdonensis]